MSRTIVGLNDPKAVKRWRGTLASEVARDSYFQSRMISPGPDAMTPGQKITDLESEAGEQVSYDLSLQLTGTGVDGMTGDKLEGTEEDLSFATGTMYIDQKRHGVNAGTVMTRKRTLHDLRQVAKDRLKEWWARFYDEEIFMYLAGSRGHNEDYLMPLSYTGRANNAYTAPDADHIMYSGAATSKASMTTADIMDLKTVDRAKTRATMMGGGTQRTPKIQGIKINGAVRFVLVMSPWDEFNVRTNATTGQWLDIQKAATTNQGQKNPIFVGSMGMYNDVILHSHQACVRFNDYGAGGDVKASRSTFMGRQAFICAHGTPGGGMTFDWHEETDDRGNELIVDTEAMFGIRKNSYEIDGVLKDFGSMTIDSAADEP